MHRELPRPSPAYNCSGKPRLDRASGGRVPARRRLDIAARKERIQTIRKGEQHGPSSRRSSLLLASSFVLPVSAEMGQSLSRQFSTFMARGSESRTIQDECEFCRIASGKSSSSTRVIYEDDMVVAFPDRSPAAVAHLLVIPRAHIAHGYCLKADGNDRHLVRHMMEVGEDLLRQMHPDAKQKMGFHMPPLNSVNHLHLHCFALPHEPAWKQLKYTDLSAGGRLPVIVGYISAESMLMRLGATNSKPFGASRL